MPWGKKQQDRNKSKPKAGGTTTRKNTRIIPRQEPKPPAKTSEVAHGRQNHQGRHQSYAKVNDQKTYQTFPRQKAKSPGKTSELSQGRRQNHQQRHQNCTKAGANTTKNIKIMSNYVKAGDKPKWFQGSRQNQEQKHKIIPRIDKIIRNKYQDYSKAGGKTTSKNIKIIPK